ncbi:MAG: hypothetical protein Q9219_004241 [cf. Caloplaca sp. 3 TL-2023]
MLIFTQNRSAHKLEYPKPVSSSPCVITGEITMYIRCVTIMAYTSSERQSTATETPDVTQARMSASSSSTEGVRYADDSGGDCCVLLVSGPSITYSTPILNCTLRNTGNPPRKCFPMDGTFTKVEGPKRQRNLSSRRLPNDTVVI